MQAELEKARNQALVTLGPSAGSDPLAMTLPASPAPPTAVDPLLAQSPATPDASPQPAASPLPPSPQPGHGFDLNLPTGGGAIDPISAAIGLGLAGAAAARAVRRKRAAADTAAD